MQAYPELVRFSMLPLSSPTNSRDGDIEGNLGKQRGHACHRDDSVG